MSSLWRWIASLIILLFIFGCGTLELGLEPVATSTPAVTIIAGPASPGLPTTTAAPTPSATVAPVPIPASTPERILFELGATTHTFATNLTPGVPRAYVLQIQAGQQMTVTTDAGVSITVLAAQDKPLAPTATQPGQWAGTIPASGQYKLLLLGQGLVTVSVNIPPPGS